MLYDWREEMNQHNELLELLEMEGISNDVYRAAVTANADPLRLVMALSILHNKGILNDEIGQAVISRNDPNPLTLALCVSQEAQILTNENRQAIIAHVKPEYLVAMIRQLQEHNILTGEIGQAVIAHANPDGLSGALFQLGRAEILSIQNLLTVAAHANPENLADALGILQDAGILNDVNRQAIAAHANPQELAEVLGVLQEARILNDVNRTAVAAHANPRELAEILGILQDAGILNDANRETVIQRVNSNLAAALSSLAVRRILNNENLRAVIGHAEPRNMAIALEILNEERILTDVNRQALRAHANPIELAQRLVLAHLNNQLVQLNEAQSTHRASVHKTVSESATRLMQMYHSNLKLEQGIEEIQCYIQSLPSSQKNTAAQNAIVRLTSPDYAYIDPVSQISTRQLLVLFWRAIQDNGKRQGNLGDAIQQLIEALYEIQRGYNIDAKGIDNNQPDIQICTAGTFNKLIEKLQGIHPAATILFVTKETALLKLPKVIKEEISSYFLTLPQTERQIAFKTLASNQGFISPELWVKVSPMIYKRMEEEFGAILNKKEIDYGIEIGFDDNDFKRLSERLAQAPQAGINFFNANDRKDEKDEKEEKHQQPKGKK